jgi:hypothetical protein
MIQRGERATPSRDDEAFSLPPVRVLLDELARHGLRPKAPLTTLSAIDDDEWAVDDTLLDAFLAPLEGGDLRDEIKAALRAPAALEEAFKAAAVEAFPEADKERNEKELREFAVSAVGAWVLYGLIDTFRIRCSVQLPGRLIRTNGDIAGEQRASWSLSGEDLFVAPPRLAAYSFAAAEGTPDRAADLGALVEIRRGLAPLDAETRAALAKALAENRASVKDDLGSEAAKVYAKLRALVTDPE